VSPDRKRSRETASPEHPDKTCVTCGRSISWRKKWERDWASVKYCSDRCRGHKIGEVDARLEEVILKLLDERGAGKTICPSEAARALSKNDWEPLMEPARAAARRLVSAGKIVITQGGVVVDPSTAKGPIRLRKA
jgi:hypothetical protein